MAMSEETLLKLLEAMMASLEESRARDAELRRSLDNAYLLLAQHSERIKALETR